MTSTLARDTHTLRVRPGDQPLPNPTDGPVIHDLVIADVWDLAGKWTPAAQAVVDDIAARGRLGVQRYGQPLQAHNGRDALRDAFEEACDLVCYLKQALTERHTEWLVGLYLDAVRVVVHLREQMGGLA